MDQRTLQVNMKPYNRIQQAAEKFRAGLGTPLDELRRRDEYAKQQASLNKEYAEPSRNCPYCGFLSYHPIRETVCNNCGFLR